MSSHSRLAEIAGLSVAVVSLVLNITIIYCILHSRRGSLILGLKLVLGVAIFDLIGPSLAIIQEIISFKIDSNILNWGFICQLLGAIHTLIPYTTTNLIALVSLERCFFIHDQPLPFSIIGILGLIHLIPGFLLGYLAFYHYDFQLSSSRVVCMASTQKGWYSRSLFYLLIVTMILNTLIITVCYLKLIVLRFKSIPKFEKSHSHMERFILHSPTSSTSFPPPPRYLNRFVIRALIIMFCYITMLVPCITLLIYEAASGIPLDYMSSSILVILMLSFTVLNPLLLILLHSTISHTLYFQFQRWCQWTWP